MRILFVAPQPFYVERGTPIAVRAAAQALAGMGHQIDLLTYHAGDSIQIPGVRHLRAPRPPLVRHVPIGPSWQKLLCDAALLREVRRLTAANHYDLLHAVEEAAFIARWIHNRRGIPYVYDMDSLMSEQIAEKGRSLTPAAAVFGALERRAVADSLGVLAVCPALVDEACKHHPSGNVALLPDLPLNGAVGGPPPPFLARASGLRLVYVGNFEHYQGVDLMIDAFARVADDRPGVTLVAVGGSALHVEHHRRLAGALADRGRIIFPGPWPVDRLGDVLGAADILVSPRRAGRNTPMKIYSYLQSGRPVLATRLPTHTQVMDDRVALLVEPDPGAMAVGMRRLIDSAELRARLGRAGRRHIQSEYSEDRFRERLRTFYDEVQRRILPRPTPRAGLRGEPAPAEPLHSL